MTRSSPSRSPSRRRYRGGRSPSPYRSRSSRRKENQPKESQDPDRRPYRRYDAGDPIYRGIHDHRERPERSSTLDYRHHRGNHYNNNHHHSDYFAHRLLERAQTPFNIWKTFPSPSPERAPVKTAETKPRKKPKRQDSHSSNSEDDSPKKSRKKDKKQAKTKKKQHRTDKKKTKTSSSEHAANRRQDDERSAEDDMREAVAFKLAVQPGQREEVDVIGPQPLPDTTGAGHGSEHSVSYGKALLPGEGQAIAQYVQKNMRIPRRGEVGWQGPEIETLETLGYVMSGSRHSRMNAIRIRKENQVYSAEEKRALALINFEEKQQRENTIMGEFRTMLTAKLTKKHGADIVEDAAEEK